MRKKERKKWAKLYGLPEKFLFGRKATGGKLLFGKKVTGGIGGSGAELFDHWQKEELEHWQKNASILIKELMKEKFPELDENSYEIEWGLKINDTSTKAKNE